MSWLAGWGKRVKLTIDNTDITTALSNFPVLLYISADSGRGNDDLSFVFDELTEDANRKKIAVTTDDGETECYIEIEKWDDGNEKAWLWTKVPSIASDADTELYLYFDSSHADNTAYVGDPSDAVVHNVWDSNFKLVSHMRDDPDASHVRDSTENANDGTKVGAGTPAVTVDGQIADAQDFDGLDDYINCGHAASLNITTGLMLEAWIKWQITPLGYRGIIYKKHQTAYAFYTKDDEVRLVVDGLTDPLITTVNANLAEDTWYYVAAKYNGSAISIFVDGTENISEESSGLIDTNEQDILLGDDLGGAGNFFNGLIDEVRISDVGRSEAWIKASYESERDDLLDWGSEETRYTKTATVLARALRQYSKTIVAKARIFKTLTKTATAKARALLVHSKTVTTIGRIQGIARYKVTVISTRKYDITAKIRRTIEWE